MRYIRQILHSALPEAEERISWSMPTYWKGHNIFHFVDISSFHFKEKTNGLHSLFFIWVTTVGVTFYQETIYKKCSASVPAAVYWKYLLPCLLHLF